MKVKALLVLVICASIVSLALSACKRREQTYAGIEGPTATETVEPNAQNN